MLQQNKNDPKKQPTTKLTNLKSKTKISEAMANNPFNSIIDKVSSEQHQRISKKIDEAQLPSIPKVSLLNTQEPEKRKPLSTVSNPPSADSKPDISSTTQINNTTDHTNPSQTSPPSLPKNIQKEISFISSSVLVLDGISDQRPITNNDQSLVNQSTLVKRGADFGKASTGRLNFQQEKSTTTSTAAGSIGGGCLDVLLIGHQFDSTKANTKHQINEKELQKRRLLFSKKLFKQPPPKNPNASKEKIETINEDEEDSANISDVDEFYSDYNISSLNHLADSHDDGNGNGLDPFKEVNSVPQSPFRKGLGFRTPGFPQTPVSNGAVGGFHVLSPVIVGGGRLGSTENKEEDGKKFNSIGEVDEVSAKYKKLLQAKLRLLNGNLLVRTESQIELENQKFSEEENARKIEEERRQKELEETEQDIDIEDDEEEIQQYDGRKRRMTIKFEDILKNRKILKEKSQRKVLKELKLASKKAAGDKIAQLLIPENVVAEEVEQPNPVQQVTFHIEDNFDAIVDVKKEEEKETVRTGPQISDYLLENDEIDPLETEKLKLFYANYNMRAVVQKKSFFKSDKLSSAGSRLSSAKSISLNDSYSFNQIQETEFYHNHRKRCDTTQSAIEITDAEKNSSKHGIDLFEDQSNISLKGKGIAVEPLLLGSGSATLGMEWMPAPIKFTFPMEYYFHETSIPDSPFPHLKHENESHLLDQIQEVLAEEVVDVNLEKEVELTYKEMVELTKAPKLPISKAFMKDKSKWVDADTLVTGDKFPPGDPSANTLVTSVKFSSKNSQTEPSDQLLKVMHSAKIVQTIKEHKPLDENSIIYIPEELKESILSLADESKCPTPTEGSTLDIISPIATAEFEENVVGHNVDESKASLSSIEKPNNFEKKSHNSDQPNRSIRKSVIEKRSTDSSHSNGSSSNSDKKSRISSPNTRGDDTTSSEKLNESIEELNEGSIKSSRQSTSTQQKLIYRTTPIEKSTLSKVGVAIKSKVEDSLKFYEKIFDMQMRTKMSKAERARYATFNDPISMKHFMSGTDPEEKLDVEIDNITSSIDASIVPSVALIRRRGLFYGRADKFTECLADLDRAVRYDPFNTDVHWFRSQVFLRNGRVEEALTELHSVTENNRVHFGAFQAKAKIYQELGVTKLAIVSYSQVIRLAPSNADSYLQRAALFESENELVYANEDYKMVRQLDPNNEKAITNLAIYSFQRQLWDDAIQAFSKLILLHQNHAIAYMFRGRANAFLARWDEALTDLTIAIQINPNKADFFLYRGCLLKERNIIKAIDDFSVSILIDDTSTNHNAYYQRAMLYYQIQKYENAVIDFVSAIDMNPNSNTNAYLNLGLIYMKHLEDYKNAHECFTRSLLHDSIQLTAYLSRAELYCQMAKKNILMSAIEEGKDEIASSEFDQIQIHKKNANKYYSKAIRDYSKCIHMCPSNYLLYLYRGRLLLKLHMMREATFDFHSAFDLNAGIAQTFVQRVLVLSFKKKYQLIIDEFKAMEKNEKTHDPSLYLLVAKARLKCNDFDGALSDLEIAKSLDSMNPQIHLQHGICLEYLNRPKDAIESFNRSIHFNPTFAKAYFHRGNCKLHLGDPSGVKELDMALQLDPKFFEAHLSRAANFYSKGQYVMGIEDCNKALKIEAASIRAHLLRGSCKCKLNRFNLAIQDFTKATNLDKNCHFAFYNRAVAYQLVHDYPNAVKDYSIVLLISEDWNSYRNRGLIYWKLGDTTNALIDLQFARDNFPEDANLHSLLALCLHKTGQMNESIKSYTAAINASPLLMDAYLGRGIVYADINEFTLAKRDYARVMHMHPKSSESYVNIAYILQEEKKYKRAWSMFNSILAINPKCTSALDGRAMIYYVMKNYFSALLDVGKAIEYDNKNAELHANKGVILQALNDSNSALKSYKIALKLNPQYSLASFNAANLYFQHQRWDNALEYYDRTIFVTPTDTSALLNRGITKAMVNDKLGAMADFDRVLELDPNSSQGYYNRAHLLNGLGKYELAEIDYSKVIALTPHDGEAYLRRGETLGHQNRNEEAMMDFHMSFRKIQI